MVTLTSYELLNMTDPVADVIIRFNNAMHNNFTLVWVWCGTNQLNLIMKHIINNIVK